MKPGLAQLNRRRFLGPGTVVALAAAGMIGYWNYQKNQAPPPVQPVRASFATQFKLPNEPDAARLSASRERLALTEEQTARVEKILAEWRAESKPIEETMKQRAEKMQAYLNEAGTKKPSVEDIQRRAAPVSEITAEYRRLRDDFQRRAIAVLTPEQQARWKELSAEKRDRK